MGVLRDIKLVINLYKGRKQKQVLKKHETEELNNSIVKVIAKSDQIGKSVFVFKEKSLEKIYLPKVVDLSLKSEIIFDYPKIELRNFENATIFPNSDIIIVDKYVIWDKFFLPNFNKVIYRDQDVIKYVNGEMNIRKPTKTINIQNGFSLCGVHSGVWSHFLVQFLPKLYLLEKAYKHFLTDKLSIILPFHNDSHLSEIINNVLNKFENIEIIILKNDESVFCKSLYTITNTAFLCDHSLFINPSDAIIPLLCLDVLKENLVQEYLLSSNNVHLNSNNKIYIARNARRQLVNGIEVEDYFKNKGFSIIEPHRLSLIDKIQIFNNAKIVIGPFSSGFSNIIFCKPKTKLLVFSNSHRTFDGYYSTMSDYFDLELLFLTGKDDGMDLSCDTYIPIEKIDSIYTEFCNNDLI